MPGRMSISVLCLVCVAACTGEGPSGDEATASAPVVDVASVDDETADDVVALPEQCDADAYRELIGTPVAAAPLPEDPMLRVYGDADIITQDYRPQRTNVVYGDDGNIVRVTCG